MDLQAEERRSISDKTWKSCCLTIDRNAAKYCIQVGILTGLIVASLTMLIYDKNEIVREIGLDYLLYVWECFYQVQR